jgi:hypothetical protein
MPAIWTDTDGRVERIHYNPSSLPDKQLENAIIIESVPDSDSSPNEKSVLYYNETDGAHYQYETFPTRLKLPDRDGQKLSDAVANGDLETVVSLFEKYN